jgi:hypothetical protein
MDEQHVFSTLAVTCCIVTKVFVQRLTMPVSHCVNHTVRHQSFWNQWRLKLRESLAHLFGLIMRRTGGDASVALRVSFV